MNKFIRVEQRVQSCAKEYTTGTRQRVTNSGAKAHDAVQNTFEPAGVRCFVNEYPGVVVQRLSIMPSLKQPIPLNADWRARR